MKFDTLEENEGFVNQSVDFLIKNEIFDSDTIINTLIIFGFLSNSKVIDVELFVDKDNKKISYYLYFTRLSLFFVRRGNIILKLEKYVKSGFNSFDVAVKFKRYNKNKI